MDDLISRQAAIDAIMGQPEEPHYPSWYAAQIEKLPSAQPERTCVNCGRAVNNGEWYVEGTLRLTIIRHVLHDEK